MSEFIVKNVFSASQLAMVSFILKRTSGLVVYSTNKADINSLYGIREACRSFQPVKSQYPSFDILRGYKEEMNSLMHIATQGESIDIGVASSGAFEIYHALAYQGVPLYMLSAPSFISGIIHLRKLPLLSIDGSTELPEDAALYKKIVRASRGHPGRPRISIDNDSSIDSQWVAEILIPDNKINSQISRGDLFAAYDVWRETRDVTDNKNHHAKLAKEIAIDLIRQGKLDPRHFENAFGPLEALDVFSDGVLQSYELTGEG